jgi:inhibitor of KinA
MGGMDTSLETPRQKTPRTIVPAGSVAIGGKQTGIYPIESPGGWNIIGKTYLPLFNWNDINSNPIKMGYKIQFHAISKNKFDNMDN